MISPNELKRKSFRKSDPENYSQTLEGEIDNALKYEPSLNRAYCDLILGCLTTYKINTLFKYIDAGYDVMISNEPDNDNDVTLTVYHYFKE